jgi:ubiquinone/menaquinone biosynthesis C-methylase UbiE
LSGAAIDYDCAATAYAANRRLHVGVFRELTRRIRPTSAATILEVGCGTGTYAGAMAECFGGTTFGLDPSAGMLAHACARGEQVTWLQGRAECLPLTSDAFDLVFSVDVIHHVPDKAATYREAMRCLLPGGWVCTVTDSEQIIRQREILSGYFPETVDVELARYPRISRLEGWMAEAGLSEFEGVTVEQPYEVVSAQPYRDKAYSSLHLISEAAWKRGVARLEADLEKGPVHGVARYVCLWGRKQKH